MKRAFVKFEPGWRFLADSEDPTEIYAEESCQAPHDTRAYWHKAGVVPLKDLRLAAKHGVSLRWRNPRTDCWSGHSITLTAEQVRLVLVALDSGLERGLPPRCAVVLKEAA